jgi:hypothetical protein
MSLLDDSENGLRHGFSSESIDALRVRIQQVHSAIAVEPAPMGQVPLHIACRASDCGNGLHCLDYVRRGRAGRSIGGTLVAPGQCRACREVVASVPHDSGETVDEVVALFDQQRRELIREHYWTAPMDRWAYNQAYRLGRIKLHAKARQLVASRIGGAQHPREGQQTSWNKDVIAYAQHAVAACCRHCVQYWHGVPFGRPLNEGALRYLTGLVALYLDLRLPDLPDEPSNAGSIRRTNLPFAGDPFDLRAGIAALLAAGASPAGLLVPDEHFSLLRTISVEEESGGAIALRPLVQQLHLDKQMTEAG